MARDIPNFYFFLKGTDVHHLNYGIFLLAAAGGYAIFRRPVGGMAEIVALVYGVGMGLTFDEFGMWLHLGGSYWQRTSVDGVIIIAALFALFGYARSIRRFESRHCWEFAVPLVVLLGFGWVASRLVITWEPWWARSFGRWRSRPHLEGARGARPGSTNGSVVGTDGRARPSLPRKREHTAIRSALNSPVLIRFAWAGRLTGRGGGCIGSHALPQTWRDRAQGFGALPRDNAVRLDDRREELDRGA